MVLAQNWSQASSSCFRICFMIVNFGFLECSVIAVLSDL